MLTTNIIRRVLHKCTDNGTAAPFTLLIMLIVGLILPIASAKAECTSCNDPAPTTHVVYKNSSNYFPGTNCMIKVTYRMYDENCPGGPCEIEIMEIEFPNSLDCAALSDGQKIEVAISAALSASACQTSPPSVTTNVAVYMGACLAEYDVTINAVNYRGLTKCGDICCGAMYVITWDNGVPSIATKIVDIPGPGAECPPINPYEAFFTGQCQSACDHFPDDLLFPQ